MEKACQQRRRQIVDDCHQLALDVGHFNSIHPGQEQYELPLNFKDDVRERMVAEGIEKSGLVALLPASRGGSSGDLGSLLGRERFCTCGTAFGACLMRADLL
jgi:hypothetical protein